MGRGSPPGPRRLVAGPDLQPARSHYLRRQPDYPGDMHDARAAIVGLLDQVQRLGQRHGQLPSGCSQPGTPRPEYLPPRFTPMADLVRVRPELAGHARSHAYTGAAAGILIAPDA